MKLTFKPAKGTLIAIAVVVAVAFGLMANGSASDEQPAQPSQAGTLDAPARQACDDFEAGYESAETKPERLAVADEVGISGRRTDNEAIRDSATELGLRASDGGPAWRSSADAFISACGDAGWSAR